MMKNFYLKFSKLLIFSILLVLPATKAAAQYASIDWAQLLGGSGYDYPYDLQVVDGYTYISGQTSSPDMPVTNGSVFQGIEDLYIAKYNSSGTLLFGSYIGGSSSENGTKYFKVVGDNVYLSGWTSSVDLPVTNGSTLSSGSDIFFMKINTLTGAVEMSTYLGSLGDGPTHRFRVYNGDIFLTIRSDEAEFPITDGASNHGDLDIVVAKLDGSTGNLIWSSYVGGDSYDLVSDLEVDGNGVYIAVLTNSSYASFPATDETVSADNANSLVYLRLSPQSGEQQFLTYLVSAPDEDYYGRAELILENGNVYALVNSGGVKNVTSTDGSVGHGAGDIIAARFDASNNLIYKTIIGGNSGDNYLDNNLQIKNGNLYFVGRSSSDNYPVTNGSSLTGSSALVLTKLNASGQIVFSSYMGYYWGEEANLTDLEIGCNDDIYLMSNIHSTNYPITNGSTSQYLNGGMGLSKFDGVTGSLVYSSYLGTKGYGGAVAMGITSDGVVQITGGGTKGSAPTTVMGAGGSTDILFMQVNTCPTGYAGSLTLSPATQSVCINGVVGLIAGEKSSILSSSLPTLYTNSVPSYQEEIPATYQWQVSDSPSGPWTDLVGATEQNYTPAAGSTTKYYRRLVQTYCCGEPVIHQTSEVAEVVVTSNQAPIANAGGIFNTCLGTPVTIGYATIATDGLAPYTVLWDNALGNVEQPTVNPVVASVYTLKITDANGCVDYDQAIVNSFKADAGVDVGNCAGAGVRIGSAPIAGVSGVIYSWSASPADASMSCTTCAQPTVSPTVVTTYTLTLTIPITGGGTCATTDEVTVTPVAAPVTANFAGPDRAICLGGTATLGFAAESGFTYTWAPGNYLVTNNASIATFQPGNLFMPSPDPMHYYVTAIKNGCSFVDQVEVSAIEANAGVDGCGPRYIGTVDRTPGINETYSWTKISGPGNFSGLLIYPRFRLRLR